MRSGLVKALRTGEWVEGRQDGKAREEEYRVCLTRHKAASENSGSALVFSLPVPPTYFGAALTWLPDRY